MKKKLVVLAIICLSLFIFRDFIIRQYFISKIEYVDYDEYILIDYLNGKKNKASYVGADFKIVIGYDENEEIENIVKYDYDKMFQYQYNFLENGFDKMANNEDRPINVNNEFLLELLRDNRKFKFMGNIDTNNQKYYVLNFTFEKDNIVTVYVDKELLYTVKTKERYIDKEIFHSYELDLDLKNKKLFMDYIN